jgi:hypothetical protein
MDSLSKKRKRIPCRWPAKATITHRPRSKSLRQIVDSKGERIMKQVPIAGAVLLGLFGMACAVEYWMRGATPVTRRPSECLSSSGKTKAGHWRPPAARPKLHRFHTDVARPSAGRCNRPKLLAAGARR